MPSSPAFASNRSLAIILAAAGAACASAAADARAEAPPPASPLTAAPAPQGVNPFASARLYVNPDYAARVGRVVATHPESAALLKRVKSLPTAIWESSLRDTQEVPRHLDDALRQQRGTEQPVVTVFVLYDLPGRDCNAAASVGELTVDAAGEAGYRHAFIDPIAAAFRAHPNQRIVAILEPDSLSNLVTNMETPRCKAAAPFYKRGIAYAITQLALPNVFVYLEAAHAGWLGFPKNIVRAAPLYKEVLTMAGGADRIRGFALNVSNYDPARDPAKTPRDRTSAASDEVGYAADLAHALADVGVTGKGFVIDTGRDGQGYIRSIASSWCNVKGAGLGERPRAAPAPSIDAYLYIKPPGESDGTSDPKAPRFDETCASDDATPGAPQAGLMFDSYLIQLAKNANPPL
jgi:cellulose 1,4-beta-cellobiosidase